jgi:hypothetical protein
MLQHFKTALAVAFVLVAFIGAGWLGLTGIRGIWSALVDVNPTLAVGVIAATSTVMGATITVMLGRYLERKRDIEAHFRTTKISIYDEFLAELFKLFHSDSATRTEELTEFLRGWQRKVILYGGPGVLISYFKWLNHLKSRNPDVATIFLMDEFFRALRTDIGQSSRGLQRGAFANMILRHADLFLEQAAKNPSITLAELAKMEKGLALPP